MSYIPEEKLMHYGMPRRSGRYPWGSGDNPYQHEDGFLGRVAQLRSEGFTFTDENGKTYTGDTAIAKSMGLSTGQFRVQLSLAESEKRAYRVATAKSLKEKGYNTYEIAEKMGFANESSVRSLLNEKSERRMNQARATADFLKKQIDEKGMIDVGKGVEKELHISSEKLKEALYILELEGYPTYGGRIDQVNNPGKKTTLKVVCPPGTEHKEIFEPENIHTVTDYISEDGGDTFRKAFEYPSSMDSKRLKIRYAEEGGLERDGTIELRRGVDDLSLGDSHYAQVRILVDGTHYLKGMAVYSDDMPDGVDVIFNTNKPKGTPALGEKKNTVLKNISSDPENPFGSLIKEHGGQSHYIDKDGNEKLSLINKRADEGDWRSWDDKLPAQFLSKQNMDLIKLQLKITASDKQAEFDEICSLTNPTVKKQLLKSFADDCDAAAVHLKAAALPRQKYQVILPVPSLKDNEVYAPNYNNGEKVALVRFPHGGTFEIPILTVNNRHPEAKKMLDGAIDAVGINSKVAGRLSGADFDGDTVMVIPTNDRVRIKSTKPLEGLEGFDPKLEYGGKTEGTFRRMNNTQTEMGIISNLITDMTLRGAKEDELARAVRHSMVVIDAEKHGLDYKQSEIDNNIKALKRKYQGEVGENGRYHEGASTLISRAGSEVSVLKRQGSPSINSDGSLKWKTADDLYYEEKKKVRVKDPATGKYLKDDNGKPIYEKDPVTGRYKYEKTGKIKTRTQQSTRMAETDDAFKLVSTANTQQERAYAEYANKMKALANNARKEMINTGKIAYSAEANRAYAEDVHRLKAKLDEAERNRPVERHAQTIANAKIREVKKSYPDISKDELKKVGQRALASARAALGAKRITIPITDSEWKAIQAGAISESKLKQILDHVDIDELRKRATPRASNELSTSKVNLISRMSSMGYTIAEIAQRVGVSTSTVVKYSK